MPDLLLPTGAITVPAALIFASDLPVSMLHTWLQLRLLAAGHDETPPFSLHWFSALTAKKISTLYGHMAALRDRRMLRWHPVSGGEIIVDFPQLPLAGWVDLPSPPGLDPGLQKTGDPSGNSENTPSLNHSSLNNIDSKEEERSNAFRETGDPARIYRSITRLSPNPTQRAEMAAAVSDLELWRASVEHWLSHGWNPRNLPGLLELYSRGGPPACRFCQPPLASGDQPALARQPSVDLPAARSLPEDTALSALDELYREWLNG